jgi:hypothetical protein
MWGTWGSWQQPSACGGHHQAEEKKALARVRERGEMKARAIARRVHELALDRCADVDSGLLSSGASRLAAAYAEPASVDLDNSKLVSRGEGQSLFEKYDLFLARDVELESGKQRREGKPEQNLVPLRTVLEAEERHASAQCGDLQST